MTAPRRWGILAVVVAAIVAYALLRGGGEEPPMLAERGGDWRAPTGGLACAERFKLAPAQESPATPEAAQKDAEERQQWLAQYRKLRDLPFEQLVAQANDEQLGDIIDGRWAKQPPPPEVASDVKLLQEFRGNVAEGGFAQYFAKPSGDRALEAVEAMKRMGLTRTRELLECALTAFPDGKPASDVSGRTAQLGANPSALFAPLDEAFLGPEVKLHAELGAWIRREHQKWTLPAESGDRDLPHAPGDKH